MITKSVPLFLFLLFVFLLVTFTAPIFLIWSLNTLFPILAIPYTFTTWAAATFIILLFGSSNLKLAVKD